MTSPSRSLNAWRLFAPLLLTGVAQAQSVTVAFQDGVAPDANYAGTRDTILKEGAATVNLGNLDVLRVTTADIGPAGPTWTLLRWDIAGEVPPGTVVESVRIVLEADPEGGAVATQFYEVRRPWSEGNGSPGSGATWLTTDGSTAWQTAGAEGGADRGSTSIGTLPAGSGTQTATLNATGVAMVQGWVDDPDSNYGVILRSNSGNAMDFDSREVTAAGNRPRLEVTFSLPGGATGGGGDVEFRDGLNGYAGTRDVLLYSSFANFNFNFYDLLTADAPTLRSVLRFDLSSVPPGTPVTAASLGLYVTNTGNTSTVYPLTRNWSETGATWNSPWEDPGADDVPDDRSGTSMGTFNPNGNGLRTTTLNTSVVQGWINDPATNFGVVFVPNGGNNWQATSREGTFNQRPRLTLTLAGTSAKRIQGGSDWSNPAAWSPTGLPGSGDLVVVEGGGTVVKTGAETSAIARLEVRDGTTLALSAGAVRVSGLTGVLEDSTVTAATGGSLAALGPVIVFRDSTLAVEGGAVTLGDALTWIGGTLRARGGTLAADDLNDRADVQVYGELDVEGLTFRGGDADGLHVFELARITRLRDARFESIAAGAGARHLTIEQAALNLNAPGCVFESAGSGVSVRLVDTSPFTVDDVILNLEHRGAGTSGAGAGSDDEAGGAGVNWVYAAPDTTRGVAIGFPQVAYDINTFAEYATYVAFRDIDGIGTTDRIHVFDTAGTGADQGFHFDVSQAAGDIVGYPWWDQLPGGQRVLFVVTSAGRVIRWTHPSGPASGAIAPDFDTEIRDAGTLVQFTSPPLGDSNATLFAAGLRGGAPRIYGLDFGYTGASNAPTRTITGLTEPVTSELAYELDAGTIQLFAGGGVIGAGGVTLFTQNFNGGPGSFSYQDDVFRGTNNPSNAFGTYLGGGGRSGGGVRVRLGDTSVNMSGGWVSTFNVSGTPALTRISISYRLTSTDRFEFDEFADALLAVDGTLYGVSPGDYLARQVGDGNGGPTMDTGWQTFVVSIPLADGPHTLALGGFLNKSTEDIETADMYFDDVVITTANGSGVLYRADTQTSLLDLSNAPAFPVVGAPFPAFGIGAYVGDSAGVVHGVDQATFAPLDNFPINAGGGPLQGSVWLDIFSSELFWGTESAQVYGYVATDGSVPLSSFPWIDPLGDARPIRDGILSDSGTLWLSSTGGRVRAFQISSGGASSDLLRFGAPDGGLGQDYNGRIQVQNAAGRYLVLNLP